MTHYLVRHSDSDYRLHKPSGEQVVTTTWSNRPGTNTITSAIAEDGPGGSLLGDEDLRSAFVDAVSGGINFRNLEMGSETVPWEQ